MVPGQNVNFTYAPTNRVIINASGILTNINTVYASNVLNAPWQWGCANLTQWCLLDPLTYTNGLGGGGTTNYYTNNYYYTNLTVGLTTNPYVLGPGVTNIFYFTNGLLQAINDIGTNVPPTTNTTVTNGLIAYWKLNEGSGTTAYDTTSNLFDGTLSGTTIPTWGTGNPYNAGSFLAFPDTSSWMNGGSHGLFNLTTGAFTIAIWAIHTNASWGTWEGLVCSDTHTSFLLRYNNNGIDNLELWCSGVNQILAGPGKGALGSQWHWIVVTRTNSSYAMWIDALLVASATSANALDNFSPQTIAVGNDRAAPGRNWRGYIGETMIYNGYALSSNEVYTIFTSYYGQPYSPFVKKTGDWMSGALSNAHSIVTETLTIQSDSSVANLLFAIPDVMFPGTFIGTYISFDGTYINLPSPVLFYGGWHQEHIIGIDDGGMDGFGVFYGNGGGLTNIGWPNTVGITTTQYITDFLVGQITNVFSNGLLVVTGAYVPPVSANALSTFGNNITTMGNDIIVQ